MQFLQTSSHAVSFNEPPDSRGCEIFGWKCEKKKRALTSKLTDFPTLELPHVKSHWGGNDAATVSRHERAERSRVGERDGSTFRTTAGLRRRKSKIVQPNHFLNFHTPRTPTATRFWPFTNCVFVLVALARLNIKSESKNASTPASHSWRFGSAKDPKVLSHNRLKLFTSHLPWEKKTTGGQILWRSRYILLKMKRTKRF